MKASELRKKYFEFFKSKNHKLIVSTSLLPENDPTVLFTTAGMHPLVPFLLGQKHPKGKRLVNAQKCIRTGDIEEVGNTTHHTFFEMLGNWSLGDYFKKEAIEFSFEFLTNTLNIPKEKLAFSCFEGDDDAPKDEEAFNTWKSLGVSEKRIAYLNKKENWWGPAGETGPCGPDSEMFYWSSDEEAPVEFDYQNPGWVEIWNDVFMQYNKDKEGIYSELKQQNVDTGMGLERTLAILSGFTDNYKTELWVPLIKKIEEISKKDYKGNERSMRIIADHVKAATMVLADHKGLSPSNLGQGYVLRRLIRRAIRFAKQLDINGNFCALIAEEVIKIYQDTYPEVNKNKKFIVGELTNEENKFNLTLEKGINKVNKLIENNKEISGKDAFLLFQSFGFPIEMTEELAKEKKAKVNIKDYEIEFKKHQDLSRTASAGTFKSGLADNSEQTTKLHSAAHLLLEALNKVLKKEIIQKGSNINPERLRLDFNFERKMTDEEKQAVEDQVNDWIKQEIPVTKEEMSVDKAKEKGAKGIFDSKYGDKISVYTIGKASKEICTGPHVKNTKEIGKFKIKKEQSVSSGVRRIKATVA
jgi:alanyl-tRNA synthetase